MAFVALSLTSLCFGAFVASSARAADAAPATFDVEAYDVDGANLLRTIDVETAVYPFLGPGRTRDDIEHARGALQKLYADRGFQSVVVEVPAQSASDHIVRLHVVEAPVGRLRVTGSRYFSPEVIRREASAFQEGQVPNIDQAQKQLTDINRLADRRVTPLLRAGKIPGTVDVDLKVSDTLPLHGGVEINNDHNQNTTPLRVISTAHYDNLWQLGHSLSFTYSVAPENRQDSEIFAGSYLAPIWGTPWSVLVFGYDSNSNVATLGGSNVLGKGYSVGARGVLQLPSMGDVSQSLSFGIDLKNFAENIYSPTTDSAGVTSTAVSGSVVQYYPVDLTYNAQREGPHFSTKVSLGVTAGTRGIGSSPGEFTNTRAFSSANFIHLNLDVTQTEALGRGFEAAQHLTGQFSDQPLVSSEQFSAGGFTSVRGYLQSEVVGDDGFSGTLELRSPSLVAGLGGSGFGAFVDELRFYAFTDGAVVRLLEPLPAQTDFFSLASAGGGLRIQLLKHLKGDVSAAIPFIGGPATHRSHSRVTFSLKSDF